MTPYLSPPMLTQGPITIATLQSRAEASPFLPQAGTLAPVSCPPDDPCAIAGQVGTSNFWLWVLLLGGGALLLSQRKKGETRGSTRDQL